MHEGTQKVFARTPELLFKDEVYRIVGAMFEVYETLGTGYLEAVYQEALAIEFTNAGVPFEREHHLSMYYKDIKLEKRYAPDFVCFGQIILELKVLPRHSNVEVAQLINYLKITKLRLGLSSNFGAAPKLEWKRYVV